MHVLVCGGGIFGQTIAWRLALRGARVTVLEPVAPGAAGSGSGDRTRIVRALYDEPFFAESGHVGLRLWDEWQAQLGARLVETIGVLYLVRREGPGADAFRTWVTRGISHVRALGAVAEQIPPAAAAARWPALATADLDFAVLEPAAGYGRAALATRTIARAATATGHVTHLAGRALHVDVTAGRAAGVTWAAPDHTQCTTAADAVVVASGFAGVALVEPLCGRLPIQRLSHWTSYWDVPYPEGAALHQSQLPAWADLGAELYGFPDDGESGFKAAFHAPRPDAHSPHPNSPDTPSDTPAASEIEALRVRVAARFPALANATCRGTYACAYDSTPDERFQIGPVPGTPGLWFVGGMSGHGFKHAPGLGESVAAAVLGAPPLLDLSPYSLRVPAP